MRAVVIRRLGGPEVLEIENLDPSEPGPGQAVVEVAAAGLNFIDTYQRGGLYPVEIPFIPGLEGAGTVTAVGPDVTEVKVGDRVAWGTLAGSYAEQATLPAAQLVPVPDHLASDEAAALMLQGLTAHYLAVDTYPLGPESSCLIHAGAGGVGLLLTQIAKRLGATVYTTVGTAAKAELSKAAGADHVIVYTEEDFAERVTEIGGPRPLDVIYDGVGKATVSAGLGLLRPFGLMVAFGNASGAVDPIDPLDLSTNGSLFLTRPTLFHHVADREALLARCDDLFGWADDGLGIRIGARFPLEAAADAHRALEGRATTGKVLIEP
ncbi:MAG: quinone oxidoreductase [Acidimicrobiia bacterium]|nr:quinone oxidoreductase [Acidimicrobiia bacterium]